MKVRSKKNRRLRWWQIRTHEMALFLYIMLFQRLLVLPIWIMAAIYLDFESIPFSMFFDTPIAGHHPKNTLVFILTLIWVYFFVCLFTARSERCYHWAKQLVLFGAIFVFLAMAHWNFVTLIFRSAA